MRTPFPSYGGTVLGGWRGSTASVFDGLASLFLCVSAVAFVGERDVAGTAAVFGRAGRGRVCSGDGGFGSGAVRCAGCSLQFAEDWVVVREKVTEEAVAVLFVHSEGSFLFWAEDARSQSGGESRDVGFVGRCEFDKPAEVSSYGV